MPLSISQARNPQNFDLFKFLNGQLAIDLSAEQINNILNSAIVTNSLGYTLIRATHHNQIRVITAIISSEHFNRINVDHIVLAIKNAVRLDRFAIIGMLRSTRRFSQISDPDLNDAMEDYRNRTRVLASLI